MKTKISTFVGAVALAAGMSALAFASQASATEANPTSPDILIKSATMVTTYTAHVGVDAAHAVDAYSNGVTFSYQNSDASGHPIGGSNATVYTLFGFCVDITHSIQINTTLNYTYSDTFTTGPVSDPLPTDFDSPTPHAISQTQLSQITALVDTGWLLHESETGQTSSYVNNVNLQLAAIQAAIWHVEGAYVSIDNGSATAGANVGGAISGTPTPTGPTDHNTTWMYSDYYSYYSSGNFHDLGDANDTFYTIVQASPNYDQHQAFAIGWPLPGVPEPTTWAMMLVGFGGLGAMLRARRRRMALAA